MERCRGMEVLTVGAILSFSIAALGLLSTGAFSTVTKQKIKEKYGNKCAETGKPGPLQIHHCVEQCMGGSDREENGVPLTPGPHHEWDNKTQITGIVYPGIPINECPAEMFKNEEVRERIIYRYENNLPLVKSISKSIKRHEKKMRKKGKKHYRGQGRRR